MGRSGLIRWSGLLSVSAGVLFIFSGLIHPAGESLPDVLNTAWVPAHLVGWVSVVFMQLGLLGLYARQAERTARLGLVAFTLAFVGTAFAGAIQFMVATVIPIVAAEAPAIFERVRTPPAFAVPLFALTFGLGYVLFGIAALQARVLPRWSGPALSVGTVLFMFGEAAREEGLLRAASAHVIGLSGEMIFGLALVWMGYALWSERQ